MTNKTKQIRIYKTDAERLKNYGRVGDSMAVAITRALDKAEEKKDETA